MMNRRIRFLKILSVMLMFILPFSYGFTYVCSNGAGGSYGEDSGTSSVAEICCQFNEIEYYIMLSGGYYLEANSNIQQLLKAIEWQDLQGVNYSHMQYVIDNALFNMKTAGYLYNRLTYIAEITPYNKAIVALLKNLDYDAFSRDYNLDSCSMNIVRGYLQNGDITGIFKYNCDKIDEIISLLSTIKKSIDNYKLPDLSLIWQLNETLAHTSLFGSHVARVFAKIKI